MTAGDGASIRPIRFASGVHDSLPVEVLFLRDLIDRHGRSHFVAPQRPSFESIVLVGSSGGSFTVDFDVVEATPHQAIRVRPGQVQVWNRMPDDTIIVVAEATVGRSPAWFPGHRSHVDLDPDDWRIANQIADAIAHHQEGFDGSAPKRRLLIELFGAVAALVDNAQLNGEASELPEAYLAFRNAIEADIARHHDVMGIASELGYSARTLSRACIQATGLTAKQVMTERLVLEAKRRLVHTRASAALISEQLGFSEPTNFTKFFVRNTGSSPSAFRQALT